MVTGHEITTRIVNHAFGEIIKECYIGKGTSSKIIIQTGGLLQLTERINPEMDFRNSDWVNSFENLRNYINEEFIFKELDRTEIYTIFEKLCSSLYWDVLKSKKIIEERDRNFWLGCIDNAVFQIEQNFKCEGSFKNILIKTGDYCHIKITVKPWLRLHGTPNIAVFLEDEYNLSPKKGHTNSKGDFSSEILSGEVKMTIFTKNKTINKSIQINKDNILVIHPSLL